MKSNKIVLTHLKLTESLHSALGSLKNKSGHLVFTFKGDSALIQLNISGKELVYDLEHDKSINYFSLVKIHGSNGKYVGDIQGRYRTKATDDSFVKAKESLVKEVENIRQQKLKALDYQLQNASDIKKQRSLNSKMKKKETDFRKCLTRKKSKNDSPKRSISKVINVRTKQFLGSLAKTTVGLGEINQSENKFNVTLNDHTYEQSRPTSTIKGTICCDSGLKDHCGDLSVYRSVCNLCQSAIQKRRDLEERYDRAHKLDDEVEKLKLIQFIMPWHREALRMVLYVSIPCVAFTICGLPSLIDRASARTRVTFFERTGTDLDTNEFETIQEARARI